MSLPPRAVLGAEALAALAVPARYAILDHLLGTGPATASQCAAVVGETPSNCSWHLRALAKVGLVERVESTGDGRTRPWRATAPGFELGGGPAAAVARSAVEAMSIESADAKLAAYLGRRAGLPAWAAAAAMNEYALAVTPGELAELVAALDALVRPYVRTIRSDVPADAAPVHVTLRAFPVLP